MRKIGFYKNLLFIITVLFLSSCSNKVESNKPTDNPNVLFISVDDLNDWLSFLGDKGHVDVKTPNFDRLATKGVYFANAHANTTACTPSRLSVMTGVSAVNTGCYTNRSGVQNKELFNEVLTLPGYLRQNGYYTMGGGKIECNALKDYDKKYPENKMWDERLPRTFLMNTATLKDGDGYSDVDFYPFPMGGSGIRNHNAAYKGHSLSAGPIDRDYLPGGKMPDELTAEWAIARLAKDYDKPFMLGVGFVRPHVPYTAPREYFDMYPIDEIHIPEVPKGSLDDIPLYGKAMAYGMFDPGDEYMVRELGPKYRKELVQGYLASVSFVDAQLGRVLDALENSKYANNTIVILWSDHGQHLGEKRSWRKQSLWQESTNSPMFWVVPGLTQGNQISHQPASLLDIYPTLVEVLNLPPVNMQDGISLVPQLRNVNQKRVVPAISTWSYGCHAVRSERWHYIRYYDGSEELYDGQNDFEENHNLAGNPMYAEVIVDLKTYLPKDIYKPTVKNVEFHTYNERVKRWSENPDSMPDWLNE